MPSFRYKALMSDGRPTEGTLEGRSRQEILSRLKSEGWIPVRIDERTAPRSSLPTSGADTVRLPSAARETFFRQLSSLLAAGVPLARSLKRLSREGGSAKGRYVWGRLHDLVADGHPLADAMAGFPHAFRGVDVAMVHAGETGGFLALVLEQIADFQAREHDLRNKFTAALIYPCVLALLSVAVVVFLMTFFIPRFESMFADFGAQLPPLTEFIIYISNWLRAWGGLVAAALLVLYLGARNRLASATGRRQWEAALLHLPIAGRLVAHVAMTRFCRMLGTLTGAGVPLITALNVARQSLGNQVLVDAVHEAVRRVQQGSSLADGLGTCPVLFPGSVLEIISVAEQTGRLAEELNRFADASERDLDRQLQTAVALAEPAMLFVMAAVVGTIVVGMVLPIFALQDYIR